MDNHGGRDGCIAFSTEGVCKCFPTKLQPTRIYETCNSDTLNENHLNCYMEDEGDENKCKVCNKNYYLFSEQGKCIFGHCSNGCIACTESSCQLCLNGYVRSNTSSITCIKKAENPEAEIANCEIHDISDAEVNKCHKC